MCNVYIPENWASESQNNMINHGVSHIFIFHFLFKSMRYKTPIQINSDYPFRKHDIDKFRKDSRFKVMSLIGLGWRPNSIIFAINGANGQQSHVHTLSAFVNIEIIWAYISLTPGSYYE